MDHPLRCYICSFYNGYPGCDVVHVDLIIKQDGGYQEYFVLKYLNFKSLEKIKKDFVNNLNFLSI